MIKFSQKTESYGKQLLIVIGVCIIGAVILATVRLNVSNPEKLEAGVIAGITDALPHPPPISGSYPYYNTYGSFGPDQSGFPQKGASYVDPIFGSTIKRLTNDFGSLSFSENYAKNGFWNSDSTLYHHNTIAQGGVILDTNTGAVVRSGVPGNYDGSFAPENPDIWYYFSGSQLREYFVSTGANSLVKDFGAP